MTLTLTLTQLEHHTTTGTTLTLLKIHQELSKEQAIADIDSLVYTISEVHPEMFTVCKQGEFLKMVSEIQEALPDSVSAWEMYVRLQPLVVRIGDGTHLCLVIINTPGRVDIQESKRRTSTRLLRTIHMTLQRMNIGGSV